MTTVTDDGHMMDEELRYVQTECEHNVNADPMLCRRLKTDGRGNEFPHCAVVSFRFDCSVKSLVPC